MTFGIRGNNAKKEIGSVLHKLVKGLDRASISYLVEGSIAKLATKEFGYKIKSSQVSTDRELVKHCDFIISSRSIEN